jgi:hypothetical protein
MKELFAIVAKTLAEKVLAAPDALDLVAKLISDSWKLDDATKEAAQAKAALEEAIHEVELVRAELRSQHMQSTAILHLALSRMPGCRLNVTDKYLASRPDIARAKCYRITIDGMSGSKDVYITVAPDMQDGMIDFTDIPAAAIEAVNDPHLTTQYRKWLVMNTQGKDEPPVPLPEGELTTDELRKMINESLAQFRLPKP